MSEANFYAGFPKTPDELYDFPPQVIWKDEDPDVPSTEKITVKLKVSLTEDKTWDIKISSGNENLLSFNVQHEYNEGDSAWSWKAINIEGSEKENIKKDSVQDLFDYCSESSVLLLGHATDEIKIRKRAKP